MLTSAFAANIGSIFGIGSPAWTGGAMQFIESEERERFIPNATTPTSEPGACFALSTEITDRIRRPG